MPNIYRTGSSTNLVHRRKKIRISDKHSDLQLQGCKITGCVWQLLADKSRTKRPRNTKICRKVVNILNFIFIARQHTDARYWYSNSVCPSVCDMLVLYENGLTYRHSFFHHTVAQSLKIGLGFIHGHWKWHQLIDRITVKYLNCLHTRSGHL